MKERRLTKEELCQELMRDTCDAIYRSAAAYLGLLRNGPNNRADQHRGEEILALASLPFSEEQLHALEKLLRKVQEHAIGTLFALIDGSAQPPGWPDELRLVNMDTGEIICPERLEWEFGGAVVARRAQAEKKG